MQKIILASQSPRRKILLEQLGLQFTCIPAYIDEKNPPNHSPIEAVRAIAQMKAAWVAGQCKTGLIIAADTVVICAGRVLGKPVDSEDAFASLALLSGQSHQVVTALCLYDAARGNYFLEHEVTRVFFRIIEEEEIRAYIRSGEPMDKAGAYGIQGRGAVFVTRIEGCYFNVVGLPLYRLDKMLKEQGIAVL
ncbi:MAG TPA: Maf family protein [Syntrophomonadaceae bacterium]|nr:Maf family protein [Syntrophomonadaceae bacterium]